MLVAGSPEVVWSTSTFGLCDASLATQQSCGLYSELCSGLCDQPHACCGARVFLPRRRSEMECIRTPSGVLVAKILFLTSRSHVYSQYLRIDNAETAILSQELLARAQWHAAREHRQRGSLCS